MGFIFFSTEDNAAVNTSKVKKQQWNTAPIANKIMLIQSPDTEFVYHFHIILLLLSEFLGKKIIQSIW